MIRKKSSLLINLQGLCLLLCSVPAFADTTDEPKKGSFFSNILPIPIVITQPAIGEGLGVILAYYHEDSDTENEPVRSVSGVRQIEQVDQHHDPLPTVTAVAAGVTNDGTKFAGIGHIQSFMEDKLRFAVGVGIAEVVSDLYILNQPVEFNLETEFAYTSMKWRLPRSNVFLGFKGAYMKADPTFGQGLPDPFPPGGIGLSLDNVGLAFQASWDTRDNTAMPNSGHVLETILWRFDENMGGDFDYWSLSTQFLNFHHLSDRFILDFRVEYEAVSGQPPFWAYPWITLRGVPAMRYQNDQVFDAEIQLRFEQSPRFQWLAFSGYGATRGNSPLYKDVSDVKTLGAGFRWKALKAHNAWIGIDYAKGQEEGYWYVEVNHPW